MRDSWNMFGEEGNAQGREEERKEKYKLDKHV